MIHHKLNQCMHACTLEDLPRFFVFAVRVSLYIGLRKTVLSQLDALLDCLFDFKDVYGGLVRGARNDVEGRMEYYTLDDSVA